MPNDQGHMMPPLNKRDPHGGMSNEHGPMTKEETKG